MTDRWENVTRNLPEWLWRDKRNIVILVLHIAILVLLILVLVLSASLVFCEEPDVEILEPEILPVPKALVWYPCECGVGIAWRKLYQEEPQRLYITQRWGVWPCGDVWWYRYEEWTGTGTLWYGTKIREFWYDAPPEMMRQFRKVLLYSKDVECFNATPTPTVRRKAEEADE